MTSQTFRFPDGFNNEDGIRSIRLPNGFVNEDGVRIIRFPNGFANQYPMQSSAEDVFSKFGDMFDKVATISDSSTKWISVTTIVCAITITVVVIRWMTKKEQTIITTYPPIATANTHTVSPTSDQHIAVTMPPVEPVVACSPIPGEIIMDRFFDGIKLIRFSHEEIIEFTGKLSSVLGQGGFGDVYKGALQNGVMIAVKVLKDHSDEKIKEQFMAEVGILGRTNHVNLVKLYGYCFDPTMKALVYEYMENGSLDKLLFDKNKEAPWQMRSQIAIGIARGLAYLHEECQQKIIHYDIKPGNVLLDSKQRPKVADFGLAKLCKKVSSGEGSPAYATARGGTVGYTAPECDDENINLVTNKCDVYSYGLMLLEIIRRMKNYEPDLDEDHVYGTWKLHKKGKLLKFFSECGIDDENMKEANRMLKVVFLCVNHDPKKRPTMNSVVKMLEGEKNIDPPSYPFKEPESSVESKEKSNARSEIELAC